MRKFTRLLTDSEMTRFATDIPGLVLPFDSRRKSRQLVKLENGEEAGLMLPPGTVLSDGDIIESEDGSQLRIQAAKEDLMLVTASDHFLLLRAGYHLGNRHASIELQPDRIILPVHPV